MPLNFAFFSFLRTKSKRFYCIFFGLTIKLFGAVSDYS